VTPRNPFPNAVHTTRLEVSGPAVQVPFNGDLCATTGESVNNSATLSAQSKLTALITEVATLKEGIMSLAATRSGAPAAQPIIQKNKMIEIACVSDAGDEQFCFTDNSATVSLTAKLLKWKEQLLLLTTNDPCKKVDVQSMNNVAPPESSQPLKPVQARSEHQPVVSTSVGRPKCEMKPRQFGGKESVDSFLAHIEVCGNFSKWRVDEKRDWLHWALKSRAQKLLWDMPRSQRETYEGSVRALRQRYGSETQCEVYRMDLRNRRRGSRENLSDLMQDIRRLMILGYGSETSPMWESVAANDFLDALNDPVLALEVRKGNVTTLDGAYREAALLEDFNKASMRHDAARRDQVRAVGSNNASAVSKDNGTVPSAVQQIQSKQTALNSRWLKHSTWLAKCKPCYNELCTVMEMDSQTRIHLESLTILQTCPVHPMVVVTTAMSPDIIHVHALTDKGVLYPQPLRQRIRLENKDLVIAPFLDDWLCWTLAEVTVFAARHLSNIEIEPTGQRLTAANGSDIEVLDETSVPLVVGNQVIATRCLVSEYVDELILGLDW
jgi:hypothetical protein